MQFSRPSIDAKALEYLRASLEQGDIGGDGAFSRKCHALLRERLGVPALLTHSCTAALEMAALLLDAGPADEVIMPSWTFVSTANAFVLRGAKPVFVDIREDTLNLDERLIERALTKRTRAIVPVHYAGVACEMDSILALARAHGLAVVEDAAQGLGASYKGAPLGTLGALGALSFHVSKNIVSGEGGALLVGDQTYLERAHILREKGTNRTAFQARKVDRYEWLDLGSSYLPSDILAALLLAQLEQSERIQSRRLEVWQRLHVAFEGAERAGLFRCPIVPGYAQHNAHIYYLLLPDADRALKFRSGLAERRVPVLTHYVPLHSSPGGRRFGRAGTEMPVTDRVAATLVRLPLHAELSEADVSELIDAVLKSAA